MHVLKILLYQIKYEIVSKLIHMLFITVIYLCEDYSMMIWFVPCQIVSIYMMTMPNSLLSSKMLYLTLPRVIPSIMFVSLKTKMCRLPKIVINCRNGERASTVFYLNCIHN